MRRAFPLILLAVVLSSCTEPATSSPDVTDPMFAKPGGGGTTTPNANASFTLPPSTSALALRGDDLLGNVYANGVCGVKGVIFYSLIDPTGGGDGQLQIGKSKCGGSSRRFTLQHAGGTQTGTLMTASTLGKVESASLIPLTIDLSGGPCIRVSFGTGRGGDKVLAEKVSATPNTWRISNTGGTGSAICLNSRLDVIATYTVFVDFTVTQMP